MRLDRLQIHPLTNRERERLQKHLAAAGVQTQIHRPIPPHLLQAYTDMGCARGDFPIAETSVDRS